MLFPVLLCAAQETGVVRAADQPIPGAEVTATQGTAKVVAYTDENGRYSFNLAPGGWEIQVQMLGFVPQKIQVSIGEQPGFRAWSLEMPRAGAPAAAAGENGARQNRPGRGRSGGGRGGFGQGRPGPGRGGFGQNGAGQGAATAPAGRPGFQSAQINPAQQDQQPAGEASETLDLTGTDADQAFLVTGSTSGGLAAAGDEESRRQQRGPGGRGANVFDPSVTSLGLPPGMGGADPLGIGGFGAALAQAFPPDFGGAGPIGGPGGGPGGPPGGFARGGRGGGGGRGGLNGQGRGNGRGSRGPFNGQFGNFGNRRRNQPAYQGSLS